MVRHALILAALAVAVVLAGCGAATPGRAAAPTAVPLKVMTFNIRYGTAKDGINHWDKRRELCASRIALADPDLLGLQEALDFQNAWLLGKLAVYTAVGVGRDDGQAKGEYSTLLYRTARFTAVASGTFWLSETPDVAGSQSWDSSLPRIATWARLRDRQAGDRELLMLNTHFDNKGPQARREAARLIRAFLAKQGAGLPLIVTGDFNAEPGSEPYRALHDAGGDGVTLIDAYALTHPDKSEPEGTTNAFKTAGTRRIDWIFGSPHFGVTAVTIDRHREGPLFPSDHFPVNATLVWK